jgi:hypothetical protein
MDFVSQVSGEGVHMPWDVLTRVNSGYDFGYLLKIVSCTALPPTETEFFDVLKVWFPCIYDISQLSQPLTVARGVIIDLWAVQSTS